ncbi:hypothetical protein ASG12_09570 [Williamsia sp. Leaf354]|nr:hypothetical protein ASG12_09570 [Williamsia sp. Leaf354]
MLFDMADQKTDETTTTEQAGGEVRIARGTLAAVTRFVRRNGGSAKAVVEPVGADGVRVLLVGDNGVMGDQVVDDVATANALVERVDGLEISEWDRELSSVANPRDGHHAKMAGWVART